MQDSQRRKSPGRHAATIPPLRRVDVFSLLDQLNEMICISDPGTHKVLFANRALKEIFKKDPVGGCCYREFRGRESPCDFCKREALLTEPEKPLQWEFYNPTIKRHFQMTERIIAWPGGRAVRLAVTADITALKEVADNLRESEQRYRQLVNLSPETIAVHYQGRFVFASQAATGLLGLDSTDELTGKPVREIIHPEDWEWVQGRIDEVLAGKTQPLAEQRLLRPDGTVITVETSSSRCTFAGEPAILVVYRDVSERKRMERMVRISETMYRELFNNMGNGVAVFEASRDGRDFVFKDFNRAAEQIERLKKEEVVGRSVLDIFPAVKEFGLLEVLQRVWRTGIPERHSMKFYQDRRISGWRDNYVYRLPSGELVTVYDDLTDYVKLQEEQLKVRKFQAASLLASGLAHDFNNILTVISGNVSLAKMRHTHPDPLAKLAAIEHAVQHGMNLTKQLLTFAQGGKPVKRRVSLGDLIRTTVMFTISGSRIQSEFGLPADLWPVEIDAGQIKQVINNITLNALQAMPEGGSFKVRGDNVTLKEGSELPLERGDYVHLALEDEGCGIPATHLSQVFDPYFTTKENGTGLGLATAYSIIKKHRGCLTVDSKPGVGTVFHLYLPAADSDLGS